ncbi:hypothetical protein C4D60_Mb09t03120 [Musa balbisiana]|uniref:Uncharacterized protein n=1 Tax=Musa balbisiana TaxID=52838 RepID=A0A4S8IDN6_MUSBA|nr:hypothetical protein C4D60_Mb09t03120 [Musa balbisiana]
MDPSLASFAVPSSSLPHHTRCSSLSFGAATLCVQVTGLNLIQEIYIYIFEKLIPAPTALRRRPNAPMRPTPASTTFDKLLRLRGLCRARLLDQASSVVDKFEAAQCGHAHHFDRWVL